MMDIKDQELIHNIFKQIWGEDIWETIRDSEEEADQDSLERIQDQAAGYKEIADQEASSEARVSR